jgi:predicted HD superfamily hydrolase involved in NAD metabolism
MIVFEASFDPITESELSFIKQYRKKHGIRDIFLQAGKEGVLAQTERTVLLQDALAPYRHLHVIEGYTGEALSLKEFEEEEKKAREGRFRLCAYGTRKRIFAKGFYLNETVHAMCNPHRAKHSLGVAATCVHLAHAHHLDEKEAWKAGMLHDITKAFSKEEGQKIIARWKPEWLDIAPPVWHSFTAVIWMKQEMKWYDQKILHAIEHHTLGDGNTDLDRILYIADKIEPGRGYDTTVEDRTACASLKEGAALIRKESEIYRKTKEKNG